MVHVVVLPDGSLHAAAGDEVVPGSRPGLARVLFRDQVANLWSQLERQGFLERGEPVAGPVRTPGAMELVYVVEYTAEDRRRRIVERHLADSKPSTATTELIRTLGALAWLRDRPIRDSSVMPIRYDFGPDPWARYRAAPTTP